MLDLQYVLDKLRELPIKGSIDISTYVGSIKIKVNFDEDKKHWYQFNLSTTMDYPTSYLDEKIVAVKQQMVADGYDLHSTRT